MTPTPEILPFGLNGQVYSYAMDFDTFLRQCESEPTKYLKRYPSMRGYADYKQEINKCRFGWQEGAEMLQEGFDAIMPLIGSMTEAPVSTWSVTGGSVSVSRALGGDPCCMKRRNRVISQGAGKIFRVLVNMAMNFEGQHTLPIRGGAILAMLTLAEQQGYATEVYVADAVTVDYMDYFSLTIPVKSAGEPLDIPRLAYACGTREILNRLMYGFEETLSRQVIEKFNFTTQSCGSMDTPKPCRLDCDIYFSKQECSTYEKAVKYVQDVLSKMAGEPTE